MERLYLLYKIERGISEADAGKKISQEEAPKVLPALPPHTPGSS